MVLGHHHRESEKANRYLEALDVARCNGRWTEVPELARKVEKHAPHRKCLALTARTEAEICGTRAVNRPSTATNEKSASRLADLVQPLRSVVTGETQSPDDAFQGRVCLGWLLWACQDYNGVLEMIPADVSTKLSESATSKTSNGTWLQVCGIRAVYLRGFAQEKIGATSEGLRTYRTLTPFLLSSPTLAAMNPQFRLWTERLLTRTIAASMTASTSPEYEDFDQLLRTFHLWTSLFKSNSTRVDLGAEVQFSRWDVWLAYYRTLSTILQRDLLYSPAYTDANPLIVAASSSVSYSEYLDARLQQRAELKRVEVSIETKLLEETRFPKANERNERIEIWVDAVMSNWHVMCGPSWTDEGLGEGGKPGIARGVLDILYRAATKSFHSTQILRHLFTVHSYLAEFDLALRAFSSYMEIVQRGKDRAEKSGEVDYSLDSDDLVLTTAAEAILVLCKYGSKNEAEKARHHCERIEKWLQQQSVHQQEGDIDVPGGTTSMSSRPNLSVQPKTISRVYHALGVSEANWALWTHEASSRGEHQARAINYFDQALHPDLGNSADPLILFSLATTLAETRDIAAAIKVVKQTLSRPSTTQSRITSGNFDAASIAETTVITQTAADSSQLMSFWHLLTLLLTSKSDYVTASQTCEAAFEQSEVLADLAKTGAAYRSEHLQQKSSTGAQSLDVAGSLSNAEKASIIEMKLTQLALIEATDGAPTAVDSSAEALALYAKFFGDPRSEIARSSVLPTMPPPPPKTAVGSIRHSLVSRARSRRRGESPMPDNASILRPSTRATNHTVAPTIEITDDDAPLSNQTEDQYISGRGRPTLAVDGSSTPVRRPSSKLQKRNSSRGRSTDSTRPEASYTAHDPIPVVDATAMPEPNGTYVGGGSLISPRPSTAAGSVSTNEKRNGHAGEQPLREIPSNNSHEPDPLVGQADEQPRWQDVRLPAPHPRSSQTSPQPQFSVMQERRHKISLLIEVWLFIASLYMRADMLDDASGAIDEASELTRLLENEIAKETSSAKAFASVQWGSGKSVEQLWADVWAQRGEQSKATGLPLQALAHFEKAVAHYPDHPTAIVGLSDLLLDIYEEKIPFEIPEYPPLATTSSTSQSSNASRMVITSSLNGDVPPPAAEPTAASQPSPALASDAPETLNRLAARDRAYMLLSTLTKMGTGWNNSEAWFALARAYECSGQVDKAKDVLWWCVELEDTRPLREWRCASGVYIL